MGLRASLGGLLIRVGLTILIVVGVLALLAASAEPGRGEPLGAVLTAKSAGPPLEISNSKSGQPIVTASNVSPGDAVSGEVTIGNSGTSSGQFFLSASHDEDPGTGGGSLAEELEVEVTELGAGGQELRVYKGSIAAMDAVGLGSFAPGQSRTYRFTVRFPPSDGDDRYQGSESNVTFLWQAVEEIAGSGEPGGPGGPGGPQQPDEGGDPNGGGGGGGGGGGVGDDGGSGGPGDTRGGSDGTLSGGGGSGIVRGELPLTGLSLLATAISGLGLLSIGLVLRRTA